ncbi:MAG: deoxyribodipyrimidine photolyase [Sphingomonas bacterium]|nr:deoxyribodipyrimidine photo-lyase [Sphingomonas bacterium]MDB5690911.1 deoxyribodipyrimidine photolyase [Sphingomonas bacterium]
MTAPSIVWFRQDLRLADQAALAAAAAAGPVIPVYVLDDEGPGKWAMGGAQRWWVHHSLSALAASLGKLGVPLILRRGRAEQVLADLTRETGAVAVHALRHYEPWWAAAQQRLAEQVPLHLHDGYLLEDPTCVRTAAGGRFRIFTPFWRALAQRLPPPEPQPAPKRLVAPAALPASESLADWNLLPQHPDWAAGFDWMAGEAGATAALARFVPALAAYDTDRNLPSQEGSSRLSPHLHFGEVSAATAWHASAGEGPGASSYHRELGWRDFTSNLIDLLPDYGHAHGRPAFDTFAWREGEAAERDLAAWTKGRTGYPIVDAGMRQLWATGWMHNRVRMITASFLVKHLLIDWRRGERWFWDTLIDADYGNNSVNWQWVAGSGVDSSPFGRIMAPLGQSAKFAAADYIRRWVPELAGLDDDAIHDPEEAGITVPGYPLKLIGHREARARALAAAR